jgi:hypothetical protein
LILDVTPAVPGRNTIEVRLLDANDRPHSAQEVLIELALPNAGIAALRRTPASLGNGRYRLDGDEFAFAGDWAVNVEVLIDDFTKVFFETGVPIR